MKLRSLKYLFVEGLKNIWVNRLMSIASVGVLVAVMVLMGAAAVFSLNVDKALGTLQDQNVALVYFGADTKSEDSRAAFEKIRALPNIKAAEFISKDDGLDALIESMGEQYSELFQTLEEEGDSSFLPDGVQVTFEDLNIYDETIAQIKAVSGVDHINDSRELTLRIMSIRQTVTIAGFWIIGLLLITALVIIANTIKITMHSRKLEISIMKAVGATNNFIRLPFVVEGMVFGIISAVISTAALYFIYRVTLNQLASSLGGISAIPYMSIVGWLLLAFCALGIIAGCIGSVFSIGKYLKREGSEFRAF